MNSGTRKIATLGASLLAVSGMSLIVAPAASAAASYNGACGSGYSVVNSARISTLGTVFLTYNSSTGYNCAVAIRDTPDTSSPEQMIVRLQRTNDVYSAKVDSGNYSSYAGPVYVNGVGACMDWTGIIVKNNLAYVGEGKATNCG
ncbi:spore-associated protein A [Streptomyces olivaceoviridis]|uniref:spore-associated protein A n=1 Tax=Streptomyces olivaceoviridis TaxID=1921 RepID=UPI0016753ED8|nr:spore-associated protein A [Streptomyces olivaceoviridis]GGZ10760.1 spore-associated protein A [Streptomyces olivaceoviridis]